mmetsp:Transcript_41834/g.30725  ORF Transcript_41834/g.30725 Transcript_41834/m.30725 type:complete len:120 (+) Transcript_41834:671-1030(+)|eukprot:CAMPEP_0202960742 /NCGR_PEP_ID=MMETSP1396-20130829/4891_1 /ASSEMBLY_ACC=CAM_ASM_000872 /TAXON_ID= /ORGANISM="Pseudokeronopsis sp., Strain Brazil" /LENGTH=119 /DNA_ID=CAMNT_0049680151 /DNA_START=660 /DNA_END=1019 /DNA_ORIENTATION=-
MTLASPKSKKRITVQQGEEIAERLTMYARKKQMAIEKLQQEQKEKEVEQLKLSIHNKKLSRKRQMECYNRLAKDAEKRKNTMKKSKEMELLKQQQELKQMFKPKINNDYKVKREGLESA